MKHVALALLIALAGCVATPDQPQTPAPPYAQDLVSLGVDPASPIATRIGPIPANVTEVFQQGYKVTLINHQLTPAEQGKLAEALTRLLPLQRRIVQERLRSISFAENLPSNAQTSRVICNGCTAFNLVINAQVLNETISQFATRKERTLFDASGSTLNVSVEAGSMSALTFILLHEATHMVDYTISLVPQTGPGVRISDDAQTPFSRGIWEKYMTVDAAYNTPRIENAKWFSGKSTPIDQAQAFYEDLKKTPFASAYAAANAGEDIAELVAVSELTGRFRQPFRIVLRDGARLILSWEPMKSPLVRARLPLLARFNSPAYEIPPPRVPAAVRPPQ